MEREPTKWFIARGRRDYEQLKGLIGSKVVKSDGTSIEFLGKQFKDIMQGDLIVLYIPEEGLVVDIFRVSSEKPEKHYDDKYSEMRVHTLAPLGVLPFGKCLNLKKLVKESPKKYFKNFPNVSALDNYNSTQKKRYVKLNSDEYNKIVEACKKSSLLVSLRPLEEYKISDSQNLSSLLGFYNSRATSFVSLLVALIVGISVISVSDLTEMSFAVFIIFSAGILYCIIRYCYYADVAEQIRVSGLIEPNYKDLNIPFSKSRLRKTRYYGLIDYINEKPKIYDAKYHLLLAIVVILLLFILFYIKPFSSILENFYEQTVIAVGLQ